MRAQVGTRRMRCRLSRHSNGVALKKGKSPDAAPENDVRFAEFGHRMNPGPITNMPMLRSVTLMPKSRTVCSIQGKGFVTKVKHQQFTIFMVNNIRFALSLTVQCSKHNHQHWLIMTFTASILMV